MAFYTSRFSLSFQTSERKRELSSILNHGKFICGVSYIDHSRIVNGGRHGHDRMVVGFVTTCEISAYHH